MGVLTVFLDKVTNLKDSDVVGTSDPYVILDLEQDNWTLDKQYGKQKSSTKTGDCNPVYGETFTWEIPDLKNMVLWVQIFDDDPLRDDKIGRCKIKLEELGLSEQPTGCDRKVDNKIFKADARIFLQISYTE